MQTRKFVERNRTKIAFIHNIYIDYRLPIFEKLADNFSITFFFDEVDHRAAVLRSHFQFKVLPSIPILMTSSYHSTLSPTLVFHLLKGDYNLFLGSGMGHFGTQIAFLVSRFRRKPFVLWDETWGWARTTLRMMVWPFIRFMVLRVEAIIVSGSKAKDFMASLGVSSDKVFVAPNAVKVSTQENAILEGERLKKKLGIQNKKIVLYFSRLIERKGLSNLIEAFAKLQKEIDDAFLVIAGEGPFKDEARKICKGLAVKDVFFAGFVNENQKASYFSVATVFVLPSIHSGVEVEIWGLVLNEAMSVAKPVISTTAVGGAYDLIRNGVNGYMIKEGDVDALYESLRKLLMNPKTARTMGLAAKKTIEDGFTFEHMAQGFSKAIKYALGFKSQ